MKRGAVQRSMGDGHDLSSPRFAGEERLEACFDDDARLTIGAAGPPVVKVQQALIDLQFDLGASGADGKYGRRTWDAVKAFKRAEKLGFTEVGDVGPGTMKRLDELFPDPTPPNPPTPPGPVVAVTEPLVCAGTESEPVSLAGSEPTNVPVGGAAPMQRQNVNPSPLGAPCPVLPFDFSGFNGHPPPGTNFAARVMTRLRLVQGSVAAEFDAAQSWVNRRIVPVPPNRAPADAQVVAACNNAFNSPNTANFTTTASSTCPAAYHSAPSFMATNARQCETVIGRSLDADRQADALSRLATHEQFHMQLACAIAELANRLIAQGVAPQQALQRAQRANERMQRQYDNDSAHGCNAAQQAAWQANINGRNLQI